MSVLNPLEPIGIGLIGVGSRGRSHLTEIVETSGAKLSAVCEIFDKRLDWALKKGRESNPDIKGYSNYLDLLSDDEVDAIIVATPDHWHSRMTIDGANAGKDVYVQKCLTRTVEEAKAIVKAVKENQRVLQLGHTRRSQPVYHRMKEIYETGVLGPVSMVNITMFRNTASGAWEWEIEPEGNPQTIEWEKFLGDAPEREFDADRYFRWRKYWDYGTGISGDLLSHEWDAVNFVMGLGIPATCVASGGIYHWKEKREVPDVLNVVYEYPDKGLSLMWNSTFSNSAYGINTGTQIYGKDASIIYNYSEKEMNVYLEPLGERNLHLIELLRERRQADAVKEEKSKIPLYEFSRDDEDDLYVTSHFQNFLDCVRSRNKTRCNEDAAFQEAVTSVMSVIAYKEKRMVRWDSDKQEIV